MLYAKREIDFKPIITECFSTDQELLTTFHIKAPATLQECVDDTFDKITNEKYFEFYSLRNDENELVGYFGKENDNQINFLTSFFVIPKFRCGETRSEFWRIVLSFVGCRFLCGIYDKNIRAMKFLGHQGKVIIEDVHEGNRYSVFLIKL